MIERYESKNHAMRRADQDHTTNNVGEGVEKSEPFDVDRVIGYRHHPIPTYEIRFTHLLKVKFETATS